MVADFLAVLIVSTWQAAIIEGCIVLIRAITNKEDRNVRDRI